MLCLSTVPHTNRAPHGGISRFPHGQPCRKGSSRPSSPSRMHGFSCSCVFFVYFCVLLRVFVGVIVFGVCLCVGGGCVICVTCRAFCAFVFVCL